jgi:hypothetical protein
MRKKRFCFVPHGGRKTHAGYEPTREAAMAAFRQELATGVSRSARP